MTEGKVSVIIPCYNQANYLKAAVDSILAQTYKNWECIIINDGSTDNTEEIATALAQNDNRFIYKKQHNKGLPGARNAGLELCSGDYIQLLDADDLLHAQKLEKHLEKIKESGLSKADRIVSYSECYYFYETDINEVFPQSTNCRFTLKDPLQEIVLNWESKLTIPAHAYFFSSNIFLSDGIHFDEKITTCEDIDCWIRIFQLKPHIIFLDEKLAYYRNTPGSLSQDLQKVCYGHVQVMEKHMNLAGKGAPLYKWARYKRNEVLFRYKQFKKMDWMYKLYFIKGLSNYYWRRLFTKINLTK